MKKALLILIILLPLVAKAQTSEDSLLKSWVYRDREFRDRSMYCLKGQYSRELVIKYIDKKDNLKKEKVKQIIKMYIIRDEYKDPLLPYEVGITEYYTLNNEKIDFNRVSFVYNEKY